MTDLLQDLRFFIGSFFAIISLILLATGAFLQANPDDARLNLIVGGCFAAFAFFALLLAFLGVRKSS